MVLRVAVGAACAWMCWFLAGPAQGHAIIVDSSPAPYAHVKAGHFDVVLRYNSRIDAERSKLVLKRGDDSTRLATVAAATPDVLRAGADMVPGDWQVVWQVLATDGHVTRGRIPFTVDAAAVPKQTGTVSSR